MNSPLRLQKFLALCGVASRRASEEIIQQGRVRVDGNIVTTLGVKVIPDSVKVQVDGKEISPQNRKVYLLLNKPKGFVTTLSDPQGRPIVTSLLEKNIKERLFPVGRLDLDTEGALILTNDGDLAQKIQHPSHEVTKTYEALVNGRPSKKKLRQLSHGIMLEGKMTSPAKLVVLRGMPHSTLIAITIHEGRKRQVRKMFQAIGTPVINLKRVAYGKLLLGNLPSRKYRSLTPSDLKNIFL